MPECWTNPTETRFFIIPRKTLCIGMPSLMDVGSSSANRWACASADTTVLFLSKVQASTGVPNIRSAHTKRRSQGSQGWCVREKKNERTRSRLKQALAEPDEPSVTTATRSLQAEACAFFLHLQASRTAAANFFSMDFAVETFRPSSLRLCLCSLMELKRNSDLRSSCARAACQRAPLFFPEAADLGHAQWRVPWIHRSILRTQRSCCLRATGVARCGLCRSVFPSMRTTRGPDFETCLQRCPRLEAQLSICDHWTNTLVRRCIGAKL